jgi:hypothetical protein
MALFEPSPGELRHGWATNVGVEPAVENWLLPTTILVTRGILATTLTANLAIVVERSSRDIRGPSLPTGRCSE